MTTTTRGTRRTRRRAPSPPWCVIGAVVADVEPLPDEHAAGGEHAADRDANDGAWYDPGGAAAARAAAR